MPTTFVFVRHAEGYHNVDGNKRGEIAYNDIKNFDAELTENGIVQAINNNLIGETFDAIYCSPLRRCRQTLLHIYPLSSKLPVIVDDKLIEQPQGKFICDKRLEKHDISLVIPMSWNIDLVSVRNPFILNPDVDENKLLSFTELIKSKYPNGKVLIVSHGVWIHNWLLKYKSISKWLNNCECIRVTI